MTTVTSSRQPHPLRLLVARGEHDRIGALFHDEVQFRSPAVYRAYEGKAACLHLLRHAAEVFEHFRYVDEITEGSRTALVFRAEVGARQVEGWDYLTHDDEGLIVEMAVMVRPLSGLIALAQTMAARLAEDPVPPA